jgi:hypothetical protein
MGMDIAFFAAEDDGAALVAEQRVGGPLGWATVTGHRKTGFLRKERVVTELGPAFEGFATRGYDPVVNMGTLEELLTGRDFESIMEDPLSGGSPGNDQDAPDNYGVISLTNTLRDALAEADDTRLRGVLEPWTQTEELQQPWWEETTVDEHLTFLRSLRDLARSAAGSGKRLYCYFAY